MPGVRLRRDQLLAAEEEAGAHHVERLAAGLDRGEVARDVDLLHEAVVEDDAVEAVRRRRRSRRARSAATCGTSSTFTLRISTRSWSTWLCFKLWSSAAGTVSAEVDRNTDVPRTRWTDARGRLDEHRQRQRRFLRAARASARRPLAQVVSTVKLTAATSSGNQPPSGILVMFEAKIGAVDDQEGADRRRREQPVPASTPGTPARPASSS